MQNSELMFTQEELYQLTRINDAFVHNFGYQPIYYRYDHGAIEIYKNEEANLKDDYTFRCDNFDMLIGWLNGAVQSKAGQLNEVK